jgi:hypothetical protein
MLRKGVAKTEGLREGQSPLGYKNLKTKFFPVRIIRLIHISTETSYRINIGIYRYI